MDIHAIHETSFHICSDSRVPFFLPGFLYGCGKVHRTNAGLDSLSELLVRNRSCTPRADTSWMTSENPDRSFFRLVHICPSVRPAFSKSILRDLGLRLSELRFIDNYCLGHTSKVTQHSLKIHRTQYQELENYPRLSVAWRTFA